jgi:hypothetical protein
MFRIRVWRSGPGGTSIKSSDLLRFAEAEAAATFRPRRSRFFRNRSWRLECSAALALLLQRRVLHADAERIDSKSGAQVAATLLNLGP